jgi:hypothetical protein
MDRSEQVAFGNWLLEKHGVEHQVTGEEIAEFYEREGYGVKSHGKEAVILDEGGKFPLPEDIGKKEDFLFPDDLDKKAPEDDAPVAAPVKGKKKKES